MPRGEAKRKWSMCPEAAYRTGKDPFNIEHSPQEEKKIKAVLKILRDGCATLLDVGCGTGYHTSVLANSSYRIWGCDPSIEALRMARRDFPNISFFYHDIVEPVPIPPCDVVTCMEVLYYIHPKLVARAIDNLAGATKGNLIVTCGQYFTQEELVELLAPRFLILDTQHVGENQHGGWDIIVGGKKNG